MNIKAAASAEMLKTYGTPEARKGRAIGRPGGRDKDDSPWMLGGTSTPRKPPRTHHTLCFIKAETVVAIDTPLAYTESLTNAMRAEGFVSITGEDACYHEVTLLDFEKFRAALTPASEPVKAPSDEPDLSNQVF